MPKIIQKFCVNHFAAWTWALGRRGELNKFNEQAAAGNRGSRGSGNSSSSHLKNAIAAGTAAMGGTEYMCTGCCDAHPKLSKRRVNLSGS